MSNAYNNQSGLNPTIPHTKAEMDNHANQCNPNNIRYGGHQEHKLAQQLNAEANACETDAIAASAYAAQMEAVAMQARTAAQAASQQAGMYAAEQSVPLAVRAPAPAGGREGQQRQEQQQTGGHTTSSQSGGLPQRGGTDKR